MENNTPGNVIQPTPAGPPAPEPQGPQPVLPPAPQPPVTTPEPAPPTMQTPAPVAAPVFNPAPVETPPSAPVSPLSQPAAPRKSKKLFLMAAVAAFVVLGGGASAYFGYILPNKPENRMARAFANLVSQKQFKTSGTVDFTPKEAGSLGVSVNYAADVNAEKNQFGLSGTVGVGGSQYPYDVRYVDKNIYLKVGGLSGIGEMMAGIGGAQGVDMYANMFRDIDDQWFVIDRSFWQSMGEETSCVTDLTFVFNDQDVDMVKAAYGKYPLFSIKNTSSASVDGTAVTKFELDPASDATAKSFVNELKDLSVVKNVRDCLQKAGVDEKAIDEELDAPFTGSDNNTAEGAFSVYLDGGNRIKKLELTVNDTDGTMKIAQTFTYEGVTVNAPEGAKPMQELFTSIYGGLGFMGGSPFGLDTPSKGRDTDRKNELKNLQTMLETFFNDNDRYPLTLQALPNVTTEQLTDDTGAAYRYDSDGDSYTLSASLENADDRDAINGVYIIYSVNQ